MTTSGQDEERSPWERAVSPDAAPIVFGFDTPADPHHASEPNRTADRTDASTAQPQRSRTKLVAVVAAAVISLVAVSVVFFTNRSDDGSQDADDASPVDTLRDLPSLPAIEEDRLDDRIDRDDDDGSTVTTDFVQESDPLPDYSVSDTGWTTSSIFVPPQLQDIEPLTLVTQSFDGVLTEVDLPSGITRSINLQQRTTGIVVGRSATLVSTEDFGSSTSSGPIALLVSPGRSPIEINTTFDFFATQQRTGTDEFIAPVVGADANTVAQYRILPDGRAELWVEATAAQTSLGPLEITPNGDVLFEDGGNVYSTSAEGVTLFAPGNLVASSLRFVLTRSCDEARICESTLHDFENGEQRVASIDATAIGAPFLRSISPDGRYLLDSFSSISGATQLTDLETGESVDFPSLDPRFGINVGANDLWAPDGSGFFEQGTAGVTFWDIESEESIEIPIDSVIAFGVRNAATNPQAQEPTSVGQQPDIAIRGVTINGEFFSIDFSTGEISGVEAPSNAFVGQNAQVIAHEFAALAVTENGRLSVRLDLGQLASERIDLDMAAQTPVIAGPAGTGWRFDTNSSTTQYRMFDTQGEDVGPVIDVPDELTVVGSDARGGLLATGSGGVVALSPSSAELLTDGELIATGSTFAIVRECSDDQCEALRVNRITGERSTITLSDSLEPQPALAVTDNTTAAIVENTVSPDGAVLMAVDADDPNLPAWSIVDLDTGVATTLPSITTGNTIAWSGDSQFAVFLSQNVLRLYDRAAGEVVALRSAPPLVSFVAV